MIYNLDITLQAKEDIRGIFAYMAYTLKVPESATEQLARLEGGIMSLGESPERFRKYEAEPWKSMGMYIMYVDKYIVLYSINEETGRVTVNRIMFGGVNIDEQLSTGIS